MSEKVKIHYGTEGWVFGFWYPTPIHGEEFEDLECIHCKKDPGLIPPTSWSIQTLEACDGSDMKCLLGDFTYFQAEAICKDHNELVEALVEEDEVEKLKGFIEGIRDCDCGHMGCGSCQLYKEAQEVLSNEN